jgi:putative transposase
VCAVYRAAGDRAEAGQRTVSTDEMTGVQALERLAPDLPAPTWSGDAPGVRIHAAWHLLVHHQLRRRQRSGVQPSSGPTRTEADFVVHVQQTVASDPTATQWHFVVDNLDIHRSASLVRYVAELTGCPAELGRKYVRGVLRSKATRAAFLSDPTHPIVFHSTPKHASWLNQVEIWLSMLVRKLLRRGNFRSVDDLRDQVLAFMSYFNRTMAKPFKWTYQGKPLRA